MTTGTTSFTLRSSRKADKPQLGAARPGGSGGHGTRVERLHSCGRGRPRSGGRPTARGNGKCHGAGKTAHVRPALRAGMVVSFQKKRGTTKRMPRSPISDKFSAAGRHPGGVEGVGDAPLFDHLAGAALREAEAREAELRARYGLDALQIIGAITRSNRLVPAGSLDVGHGRSCPLVPGGTVRARAGGVKRRASMALREADTDARGPTRRGAAHTPAATADGSHREPAPLPCSPTSPA